MGKIRAGVILANRIDVALAARGLLEPDSVRSVTLDHVLVDTGATSLCLPRQVIERLGLELLDEVTVETATGIATARVFQDASLTIEGRTRTFECLELPGGTQPLLGVIPLEALGIDLDLANERTILRPDWGEGTYLSIL